MSDTYVQQQLCKKLDEFGTMKVAKNTLYRQVWNWEGESRWTLLYSMFDTLQQSCDFVNSIMPTNPVKIDSLPARYMLEDRYKKQQQEQALQTLAVQKEEKDAAERKKTKKPRGTTATSATTATSTSSAAAVSSNNNSGAGNAPSIAQEAVLVAKNVDRVLSMRSLQDSLCNVKIAIAQFCNKSRYKRDEELIALFMSLLNSATRIAQRIEIFLSELKAM
jgi:hypothetical protein